jgi:hypothetical protein
MRVEKKFRKGNIEGKVKHTIQEKDGREVEALERT